MDSVLRQSYPRVEYVVIDGGSTDGSLEILRQHSKSLKYWRSAPDQGQIAALDEGFSKTSGEIMAWINSDDQYVPWAFQVVADVFQAFPQVEWLTTLYPLIMDEAGRVLSCRRTEGYNRTAFYRGRNLRREGGFYSFVIQQESTFWRRSLWERAGAHLDESLHLAGDFELWARFFSFADLYSLAVPLGCFRFQESSLSYEQGDLYRRECEEVLGRYGVKPPGRTEQHIRRWARNLPSRWLRIPRLAYCVKLVEHAGRGRSWILRQAWIV
jgi:glycosyltransferase involved in cell wall biosynthesis